MLPRMGLSFFLLVVLFGVASRSAVIRQEGEEENHGVSLFESELVDTDTALMDAPQADEATIDDIEARTQKRDKKKKKKKTNKKKKKKKKATKRTKDQKKKARKDKNANKKNKKPKQKGKLAKMGDKAKGVLKNIFNAAKETLVEAVKEEGKEIIKKLFQEWASDTAAESLCECSGTTCHCCGEIPILGEGCLTAEVNVDDEEIDITVAKKDSEDELAGITLENTDSTEVDESCMNIIPFVQMCLNSDTMEVNEDKTITGCFKIKLGLPGIGAGKFCIDYDGTNASISGNSG